MIHHAIHSAGADLGGVAMAIAALSAGAPAHARIPDPDAVQYPVQDLECLTLAVAYEAGYERLEGKQAVAEVVLNRLRSGVFQNSVCGVVFAGSTRRTGCQFSFTCDGSLKRHLPEHVMTQAKLVAADALADRTPARVQGATHYHANYVSPYWAPTLTRITQIGAHIFYQTLGKSGPHGPAAMLSPITSEPAPKTAPPPPAAFAPWGLPP